MNLECIRCEAHFENAVCIGYCPDCLEHFLKVREKVHAAQRPAPGVCADGKFTEECPKSFHGGFPEKQRCGLCGSDEIDPGYGLGTGCGMGSYNYCLDCNHFLDFVEDTGD